MPKENFGIKFEVGKSNKITCKLYHPSDLIQYALSLKVQRIKMCLENPEGFP